MVEAGDIFADESKMQKVRDIAPGMIDDNQIREWFSNDEKAIQAWNVWKGRKITRAVMELVTEKVFGKPFHELVEKKTIPGRGTIDNMRTAIRRQLREMGEEGKAETSKQRKRTLEEFQTGSSSSANEAERKDDALVKQPEKRPRTDEADDSGNTSEFHAGREEMTVLTFARPPKFQDEDQEKIRRVDRALAASAAAPANHSDEQPSQEGSHQQKYPDSDQSSQQPTLSQTVPGCHGQKDGPEEIPQPLPQNQANERSPTEDLLDPTSAIRPPPQEHPVQQGAPQLVTSSQQAPEHHYHHPHYIS